MSMPKLGNSISALVPAPALKFGAKWLDKLVKLNRPWLRTQEYAPVASALIAGGMMYTDTYPDEAAGVWDGSLAMFGDELLSTLFSMITRGNPGHSAENPDHASAGKAGRDRKALNDGSALAEAQRLIENARVRQSVELPMALKGSILA